MIHNIRQAFNDLLVENEWMDMETRAVAREKANAIKERIGYPDYIIVPELLDRKLETVSIYKYVVLKGTATLKAIEFEMQALIKSYNLQLNLIKIEWKIRKL